MRWPFMRKPKRVIIATAANPMIPTVNKLIADVAALRLERDRLQVQVAELLPWALVGASHVSRFESDDIGTAAPIGDKVYPLTKDKAAVFVERINNGEFTESS